MKRLLAILVGAALGITALRAAERPHVVVFLADDLSQADCSIYGAGEVRTPNLDRLAAAGMTFDRAYVASPSCAPSRAALLTGLMPARNGCEANHTKARTEVKKWPAYFAELGYEVAAFGKVAHYEHNKDYGFTKTAFEGFHDYRGIPAAVKFLAKHDRAKPLCLLVGTNWPHRPWPKEAEGYDPAALALPPTQVDTPELREARARYLTAVSKADHDLGVIYDAARARLGEETCFLFSSDHGAQWPFGKWNCYEAGVRVPLVVAWPGAVQPGTRTEAMVSWVDILPTLLAAARGAGAPARELQTGESAAPLDGRSFLPVLRGEKSEHRDRLFTTHSGDREMNVYPIRALRAGDWKYLRNLHPEFRFTTHVDRSEHPEETEYWRSWERAAASDARAAEIVKRYHQRPPEELYDLRADPHELLNLAAEPAHAGRLAAMRAEVTAWMLAQGDKGTVFNQPVLLPKASPAPAAAKRPHIIFILADDLGFGDLGCYGGAQAPTPNLDRLASEGTRFTQSYSASPICSPARAGLLTGMHPARWQLTSFLQTRAGNRGCGQADFLDPQAPSLPRRLKSAGYATAHFGKWHLGGGRDVTAAPKFAAYGYDEHASTWESPEPHPDLTGGDWIWSPRDKVKRGERTAFFVDRTLDFLRRKKDAQPCFVNLWPDDVHTPWLPEAGSAKGDTPANFRRVLAEFDRQLGRLLAGLRELGLEQETLVIFTSDNGPLPTFEGVRSGGLRAGKLSLYEGGIRVPLLVRWPGQTPAGRVDERTVIAAADFFPTLTAIAGAELPTGRVFDGEDMIAALRGTPVARSGALFWEYGRNEQFFKFPSAASERSPNVALREGRWKLLVKADGSRPELYDVVADRGEMTNLAGEHPDVTLRLRERALSWRESLPENR